MEDIKDIYFDIKRALPNDHEAVRRLDKALEDVMLADAEQDAVLSAEVEEREAVLSAEVEQAVTREEEKVEMVCALVEGIQDWNRGIVDGEELVQLAARYEE